MDYQYSEITPEIIALAKLCTEKCGVDPALYTKYEVKRGLRDINGKGVVAGLTEISEVHANDIINGESIPCEGRLYYRGINVEELVAGFMNDGRFGFEETVYLLLFGSLPNQTQLNDFRDLLSRYRTLPTTFVRDIIMKAPSPDMMNTLARSVLTLYAYDDLPNDTSIANVLAQCMQLIALFPVLAVYGYHSFRHYHDDQSLIIHSPQPQLSTAENILHLLRSDSQYTQMEARVLDLALVLHAEHGGGNNSSFTTHVVSSSGTDTYSVIAAALGSLKGPKHGGANIKVTQMFDDMKKTVNNWTDEEEVKRYLVSLLRREGFDKTGLIYGMGHAVYSLSDPRAKLMGQFVKGLSEEKGRQEEYALYSLVERIAPKVIAEERRIYKGVSANVDFYSGFIYSMLDLPAELYTPLFAIARIAGWSAHRIEELLNDSKIMRPAYQNIAEHQPYKPLKERI